MSALVAQSVEHHPGKVGVAGSNPAEGLKSKTVYTEEIKTWHLTKRKDL